MSLAVVSNSVFRNSDGVVWANEVVDGYDADVVVVAGDGVYPGLLTFAAGVAAKGKQCVVLLGYVDDISLAALRALSTVSVPPIEVLVGVDKATPMSGVSVAMNGSYVGVKSGRKKERELSTSGAIVVSDRDIVELDMGTDVETVYSPDVPSADKPSVWVVDEGDYSREEADRIAAELDNVEVVFLGSSDDSSDTNPSELLDRYLVSIGVSDRERLIELYKDIV